MENKAGIKVISLDDNNSAAVAKNMELKKYRKSRYLMSSPSW